MPNPPKFRPEDLDGILSDLFRHQASGQVKPLSTYISRSMDHAEEIAAAYFQAKKTVSLPQAAETRVGQYRLIRELGRGGQAVVWLAEDEKLNRRVALKLLQRLGGTGEKMLSRFGREAEITSGLDHPTICPVYDVGLDEVPFIAMRFVDGMPLSKKIREAREARSDDPAAEPFMSFATGAELPHDSPSLSTKRTDTPARASEMMEVIHLIEKCARGLHVAHEEGVIHRDIKPGNIMVSVDGEPIILDFGLAKFLEDETPSLTMTGDLMGTPAYMSPEQLTAKRIPLDRRTDVYSLGVTLFECLTLRHPFEAPTREGLYQAILTRATPNPRSINKHIPTDLIAIIETAMAKDRDARYLSAELFAEDLGRYRKGMPISVRRGPLDRLGYKIAEFDRLALERPWLTRIGLALFAVAFGTYGIHCFVLRRPLQGIFRLGLGVALFIGLMSGVSNEEVDMWTVAGLCIMGLWAYVDCFRILRGKLRPRM